MGQGNARMGGRDCGTSLEWLTRRLGSQGCRHRLGADPTQWMRMCFHTAGLSRTPTHNAPETLRLTAPTPRPMLGISGLLNLLTWVEHRQLAQASPHEEGGALCPVSYPTQFPPARFQAGHRSVDGSAPDQSEASPLAPELPARTPVGTKPRPKQGGQR